MRGIYTSVNDIRRLVFCEVAKLSYEYKDGDLSKLPNLPYEIIPGEVAYHRKSIFLERAIVEERIRLALGLNLRESGKFTNMCDGAQECVQPEKYYQPPLINIIKFACHRCPDNEVVITDACQGCLAHPCKEVCPKDAVIYDLAGSKIDTEKCIKCGKCIEACSYNAVIRLKRPCAEACGMKAIHSDELGRADIDYENCVSCGMCLANCPFGAIADKAQIFQTIQAIKSDTPVYVALAPAFAGQFGHSITQGKLRSLFKALGFDDVFEVAIGADLCTIEEAKDFAEKVPNELPFMATSCCPAWSVMAKKLFPEQAECISMALTPMVLTGRLIKKAIPGCKVAFVGPCAAKKLEASRRSIRSDIDFVLTFEEIMGMIEAKEIDVDSLEEMNSMQGASADGRGFAVSGGVANAVANCIKDLYPDIEFQVERAEGLENCKKMLTLAKAGKYNGYLLEGMACPGGCIGGAGTVLTMKHASKAVEKYTSDSGYDRSNDSVYKKLLERLES